MRFGSDLNNFIEGKGHFSASHKTSCHTVSGGYYLRVVCFAKEDATIKDKAFSTGNSTIYDVETYIIQEGYRTSHHEL